MSWRTKANLAWLRGQPGVKENEALASRTSFGIGGPADFFVELARPEAIEKAIEGCRERDIPYLLLGAGTNLLVADRGVEGLVVRVVNREHQVDGTRVLAAAGLKGARQGAAVVSELHGNFIVNEGGATAVDVRRLIERVMVEVKRRFGVQLEPEVELVGQWT